MSDQISDEVGQEDDALAPELARLDELLLAEGRRWRRNEPSTARLERHVHALARPGVALPRNEERMHSERNQALDTPTPQPILRHTPPRGRGLLALVATVLLVAMAASVFAFLSGRSMGTGFGLRGANATPTPGFTRVAAIQPKDTHLPMPANAYLSGLSFSSAHDGWAVGGIITPNQPGVPVSTGRGVLVHYHDGVWTAASNSFLGMSVDSVSMVSADDGWAVGHVNDTQADYYSGTVLLHFTGDGTGSATGGAWNMVSAPALVNLYPRTIHMFSPDSGYITGVISVPSTTASNSENQHMAVGVYQNGAWTLITTPFASDTSQVVMLSPNEGWMSAVANLTKPGGIENQQATVYHYLNGTWMPALTFSGYITSLSAASPSDIWALAVQCVNCSEPNPQIEHYNGTTWERVSPPGVPDLSKISGFGASELTNQSIFAWATGEVWLTYAAQDTAKPASVSTVLWEYVNGGWRLISQPITGGTVVALTTDGNGGMWAIAQNGNPFSVFVLYTQGNDWKVYGRS